MWHRPCSDYVVWEADRGAFSDVLYCIRQESLSQHRGAGEQRAQTAVLWVACLGTELKEQCGGQRLCSPTCLGHFLRAGDLNPGERHSRASRDDGAVTLCILRAATVLSRNCCTDSGLPLTRKVMSHSRDGPGVTTPLLQNIVPLTGVWNPNPPPSVTPPLKNPRSSWWWTRNNHRHPRLPSRAWHSKATNTKLKGRLHALTWSGT